MQRWCLCPFKMKSLVHSVVFPPLIPLSFPLSPAIIIIIITLFSLFSLFKLWRCCIRYTVILNEQWERHSVHSVYFCSFSVAGSVSLWSLMKCTAHLCLWNQECMLMCVCVCARACISVCLTWCWNESHSNQVRIKVGYQNQCPEKESSNSVSVCELWP